MWYYDSGGASQGPVDADEIRRLISAERVTRTTRIWREGFPDWIPAGQTEFGAAFPAGYGMPPAVQGMPAYPQPLSPYPGYGQQGYPGHRFAGFWIRLGAHLIDSLMLVIVSTVFTSIVVAALGGIDDDSQAMTNRTVITLVAACLILLVMSMLYIVLTTAGRWQGTLGKRAVGIYVIPAAGGRVGVGLSFGRYFAQFITNLVPFSIGYMMAGWTNEKRALHDMICDTRVVYGRP